jgi:hypothetical protein
MESVSQISGIQAKVGLSMSEHPINNSDQLPEKQALNIALDTPHLSATPSSNPRSGQVRIISANGSEVIVVQHSHLIAGKGARVVARRGAQVTALMAEHVIAQSGSHIIALAGSRITALGGSYVTAHSGSQVMACCGSQVNAFGEADITEKDGSRVTFARSHVIDSH